MSSKPANELHLILGILARLNAWYRVVARGPFGKTAGWTDNLTRKLIGRACGFAKDWRVSLRTQPALPLFVPAIADRRSLRMPKH
jgi:hypothetical protein